MFNCRWSTETYCHGDAATLFPGVRRRSWELGTADCTGLGAEPLSPRHLNDATGPTKSRSRSTSALILVWIGIVIPLLRFNSSTPTGFPFNMRPRIDLDPYKDEIIGLFHQKYTTEIICALMKQRHSLDLSDGTLSRRLREWGLRRFPAKTFNDADLRDRIQSLVRDGFSDKEIVEILRREEGYSHISQSKVSKTRRKLGLRLRTDDPQARREQEAQIEEVIRQEIQQREIEGYGRRLLHSHLRAKGHVFPR